jgi:hypothetical protein
MPTVSLTFSSVSRSLDKVSSLATILQLTLFQAEESSSGKEHAARPRQPSNKCARAGSLNGVPTAGATAMTQHRHFSLQNQMQPQLQLPAPRKFVQNAT